MKREKIAIKSLSGYLVLMIISTLILNNIKEVINGSLMQQTLQIILQAICSIYLIYIIIRFYGWKNVGFKKVNKKALIWFIPHMSIIIVMMYTFVKGIYSKSPSLTNEIWIILFMNFIGCLLAGASEEIIFRGIMLNSFKSNKSIIKPMIIGSLGFGVIHIGTVILGMSLTDALVGTIKSCLVGLALVALTIKINSIVPAIIFHVLWNFIIMASNLVDIEISKYYILECPINIMVGVILGLIVIRDYKYNNKSISFCKNYL